jgi:hypothetical protein
MTKGRVVKRVLIVIGICIILIVLAGLWYIPTLLNNRITSYVEENTEFSVSIENIAFSGHRSLVLKEIHLRHKLNRDDYIKSKGYQTDWIDSKASSIYIYGIDWKKLLWENNFYADRVLIVSPDIYVFRDKRIGNKYKYRALPAALLREASFPFSIPVAEIKNGKVVYEEVTLKTKQQISVPFTHLYASIYHISSDSLYLSEQPVMTIDAQAMVFDSVRTSILYTANTRNRNNVFTLEGNMKAFSARLLNKCITPAANVVIEDGFINQIYFKFTANENEANGTMNMDHKNLKLKVHKIDKEPDADAEPPKKSRFKTFMANLFVRNKDKKAQEEDLPENTPVVNNYTGRIHFERRKDRFIFNYWWNSFKSGVVSTVVKMPIEKVQH